MGTQASEKQEKKRFEHKGNEGGVLVETSGGDVRPCLGVSVGQGSQLTGGLRAWPWLPKGTG